MGGEQAASVLATVASRRRQMERRRRRSLQGADPRQIRGRGQSLLRHRAALGRRHHRPRDTRRVLALALSRLPQRARAGHEVRRVPDVTMGAIKAYVRSIIFAALAISVLLAGVAVYAHRIRLFGTGEVPAVFGTFFGSLLGVLSALSAVAYGYDLQRVRDQAKERRELLALAIALRAECKGVLAEAGGHFLNLEYLLKDKSGEWVDLRSDLLSDFRIPGEAFIEKRSEHIALLGDDIAEYLLHLRFLIQGANRTLASASRPIPRAGDHMPLKSLKRVLAFLEGVALDTIKCRNALTVYIGDGDEGLNSIEEMRRKGDVSLVHVDRANIPTA